MTLVIEGSVAAVAMAASVAGAYCREYSQRCCCGCCCSCGWLQGLRAVNGRAGRSRLHAAATRLWRDADKMDTEEFEKLIAFLAAVPLFQKQLPKSELPKVAQALRRQRWMPGEKVVEQGMDGKAFFIIQKGEASVMVADSSGQATVRAQLYHADYFGGHTLTENRPNVATIACKGPQPLETLSLSREEFERLGLHKMLKFPARPAIYQGRLIVDGQRNDKHPPTQSDSSRRLASRQDSDGQLPEEDVNFICKAVQENPNFRARGFDAERVRSMAGSAKRTTVRAGAEVLAGGELSHDFYVVARGTIDAFVAQGCARHGSVEDRLATKTIQDRLLRKQEFLMDCLVHEACVGPEKRDAKRNASMIVGSLQSFDKAWEIRRSRQKSTSKSNTNGSHADGEGGGKGWYRSRSENYGRDAEVDLDLDSPFQVGDAVDRIVMGDALIRERGKVIEILKKGPEGEALVDFSSSSATGAVTVNVQELRPVEDKKPVTTRRTGECIGELALLYNTRQMATFRAREESVVFVVEHATFKACFGRETAQFQEFCRLLDKVHMLTPLLRLERAEMARNSTGLLKFEPGEMVLQKGAEITQELWYVVEKGSCTVARDIVDFEEIVEADKDCNDGPLKALNRGGHFGEHLIFKRERISDIAVKAGPAGLTCLVFDGEILRNLKSLSMAVDSRGNMQDFSPDIARRPSLSIVALEHMSVVAILGEGGFGSVYLARHEGKEYALKRMSKGYILEQNMQKQICAERDILSMVDSPFIIRMFRSYKDAQFLWMVLEFATGGHLYTLLCDRSHVLQQDEPRGSAAMFYAACVACALEHMHERNIVYRDLKPENILMDGKGYAKICDLGFARFVLGKTHTMVGTPEYMAPEMIDSPHAHDAAVDWWALGVLTFELLTLQVPWDAPDSDDVMLKIMSIRRGQATGVPEELFPVGLILAKDFVRKLLVMDQTRRLGHKNDGSEVRKHPWFSYAGFDFAALAAGTATSPYQTPKKVVERVLPQIGTITSLATSEHDSALFVEYQDDGSGWDESF